MFLAHHHAATALLVGTILAAAAAEWIVTFRERLQTMLPPDAPLGARVRLGLKTMVETTTVRTQVNAPADRGTKVMLVGSLVIAIAAAWTVARRVTSLEVPGNGWAWVLAGVAVIWLGIGLRVWSITVLGRFFRRDVLVQVVSNRGMKTNGEALSKKLPAEPLAVGIEITPRRQFGADGDEFDFHRDSIGSTQGADAPRSHYS